MVVNILCPNCGEEINEEPFWNDLDKSYFLECSSCGELLKVNPRLVEGEKEMDTFDDAEEDELIDF